MTDPVAENLLVKVILNSSIFRYPQDYILGRDTFDVESFNNVMNIYQDKRIAFGDMQYNARSNLAVLQWNENVDRDFTSISNQRNTRPPRSQRGKKNYKQKTFVKSIFFKTKKEEKLNLHILNVIYFSMIYLSCVEIFHN